MSENWDDFSSNSNNTSNQREGRGRGGRGGCNRGRGGNRSNDFDSPSQDSWGNGGGGGYGGENNEREGGSRGRGGRGGGRGRGGGNKFSDNANNGNGDNGDFNGGDQPPVSDKTRPTYIPPEIDDNDFNSVEVGTNFDKYQNIEVKVSGDCVPKHIESFKSSGLREVLIEKLAKCNYTTPTPIQKYAIPVIINGRDMMASAQTGSGKTVSI